MIRGSARGSQAACSDAGLPPEKLIVELTEDTILDANGPAADILRELRDLGVRFMVDDFGTGYSNLSYLNQLPLHGIKIDRAFITHVDQNPKQLEITRAIVRLAHELGLVMVAEGVERAEELKLVRELGIEYVQGFLLAEPQTKAEALAFAGHPHKRENLGRSPANVLFCEHIGN